MVQNYIKVSNVLAYSGFLKNSFHFEVEPESTPTHQELIYKDPLLGDTKFIILERDGVLYSSEFLCVDEDHHRVNKKCNVFFYKGYEDLRERALFNGAKETYSCNAVIDPEGYNWGIFNVDKDLIM